MRKIPPTWEVSCEDRVRDLKKSMILLYVSACVWISACSCVCVCEGVCGWSECVVVCMCWGGAEVNFGFPWVFCTLCFEKLCFIDLELITQSSLVASEPQGPVCLCLLLVLLLHGCSIVPGLVLWVLGIKFRPPYILLNALSLQPATTFLYMQSFRRI